MSNPFFTASGAPGTKASVFSAQLRSQFASVQAGFERLMGFSGNAGKVPRVNPGEGSFEALALASGKYIPVVTPLSVHSTAVFFKFRWIRVGSMFSAEGYFLAATDMGGGVFTIPLPIATVFADDKDCLGKISRFGSGLVRLQGDIQAVPGTNKAQFYIESSDSTGGNPYRFELGCEVM